MAKASETTWVIQSSLWDDGDHVVSVRPDWEQAWKDVPIGKPMSPKDAALVAEWLKTAIRDLMKIAENMLGQVG